MTKIKTKLSPPRDYGSGNASGAGSRDNSGYGCGWASGSGLYGGRGRGTGGTHDLASNYAHYDRNGSGRGSGYGRYGGRGGGRGTGGGEAED